jgi:hypothetical protein
MGFPKFKQDHKEPIFCWLYGVARGGKTTLALDFIRENQPGVVIPMDQRFEVYRDLALAEGVDVWPVSDPSDPTVWASADHIMENLRRNFPGSGARSLVWDSISPEFRHWVEWAMAYADKTPQERQQALGPKFKNKSALFQPKAHYMEQVAMIANYGVSCIWVSHEHQGGDQSGNLVMKTSITDQERLKFQRNVNLVLKVHLNSGRYGVEIEEARNRPELNGRVIWDEPGNMFKGVWKQIEAAFYAAQVVDWDQIEQFASDRQAADLAMEQTREVDGEIVTPFKNVHHALNALAQVKEKTGHQSGIDLAKAWKTEVEARLQAAASDQSNPPAFKTLEDLLFQMHLEFNLKEGPAKKLLKELGFTSLPANGGLQERLAEMYAAVKEHMEAQQ